MLSLVAISKHNQDLLQDFLAIAGKSLTSFRYFQTRPLSIIDNHIATYLLQIDKQPVAYGHLDKEASIIWLGIAVAEQYTGRGLGKLMMQTLLTDAKIQKVKCIRLSVDNNNEKAIALYKKMGFKLHTFQEKTQFLQLEL